MAGNNQIGCWNKSSRRKENNTKNQWHRVCSSRKSTNRQILIETNQKAERDYPILKKSEMKRGTEENQRIIRPYFNNLFFAQLKNLMEVDNVLDKYCIPKLSQSQIN